MNMNINVHSASLKGLRNQNEDAHEIIINYDGKNCNINNVNFYAIFDGHGGKSVSTFVKDNLPKFFTDKKVLYPLKKAYVINVYDHLQKLLKDHRYALYSGSTGLVVIQFKKGPDDYLNVINNGDSRCVICRDNFAMPLTKDHKPSWPEEHHRITQLGGEIKFDGMDWRIKDLSVSRAFGDVDAQPFVTHRPEIFRYKLDKADKFLVLACDGLWDVLSNSDVVNFVLLSCYDGQTKERINQKQNIAKKLADYAINKGSTDNVSVLVVFLN